MQPFIITGRKTSKPFKTNIALIRSCHGNKSSKRYIHANMTNTMYAQLYILTNENNQRQNSYYSLQGTSSSILPHVI